MGLIDRILVREGGVADVGDGQGITRWGQTPAWLQTFGLPVPHTAADAAANYTRWLTLTGLWHLITPDDSLADVVVDWAVHSGHKNVIRALQRALGVTPDAWIGPQTRVALTAAPRRPLAGAVLADRMEFVGKLITRRPSDSRYAYGWLRRLAAQVRTLSLEI